MLARFSSDRIERQMGLFVTLAHSSVSSSGSVYAFGANFTAPVWLTWELRAEFFFCQFTDIHYVVPALCIAVPMETAVVLDCNFRNCQSDGTGAAMEMDASVSKTARVCGTKCRGQRFGLLVHYSGEISGAFRQLNHSLVSECEALDELVPAASVTTNRDPLMVSALNVTHCVGRAAAIGIFHEGAQSQQHRLVANRVLAHMCRGRCVIDINHLEPVSSIHDSLFVSNDCEVGIIQIGSSLDVFGCFFSQNEIPSKSEVVFSEFLSEGDPYVDLAVFEVRINIANCLFAGEMLQTSVFVLINNSWEDATVQMTGTYSCPALPIPTGSPVPTMTVRATQSSRLDPSAALHSLLSDSLSAETAELLESVRLYSPALGATVVCQSFLVPSMPRTRVFTVSLSDSSEDSSSIQTVLVVGILSGCLVVVVLAVFVCCRRFVWARGCGSKSARYDLGSVDGGLEPSELSLDSGRY
jgi:hypothetical protein